ncbi:MAG: PAS domain S-box protein [Acidobacteriota bacterium]
MSSSARRSIPPKKPETQPAAGADTEARRELEPSIAEQLLELQRALQAAPNEGDLAQRTVCGLAELPGVVRCMICIEGSTCSVSPGSSPVSSRCPAAEKVNGERSSTGCSDDCPVGSGKNPWRFRLRTSRGNYGALFLHFTEASAPGLWRPFLDSAAKLVASHIENARSSNALDEAQRALESQAREHTRALSNSTQKYQALFEQSANGIFLHDLDGNILDANKAAVAQSGYSKDELLSSSIFDLLPEDSEASDNPQEIGRGEILRQWRGWRPEQPVILEVRHRRKDGSVYDVEINTAKVRFEGRELILAIVRDITERKQAEEILAEEAIRRRILVEQSRDGIVVMDENGKVYEANKRFAEMLGYSPEEMLELHVWDWDRQIEHNTLKEMIRTVDEKGHHFETLHCCKDGSLIDVEISTNGAICGGQKLVFCVCRDITKRKQAEGALRESEERLRAIFDSATDAIYLKDTDLRYTHCNQATARLFGRPREEILGRTDADLFAEEDFSEIVRIDRQVLEGTPMRGTFNRRIGGTTLAINTNKSPVRDASGRVVGLCGVSRDITQEVRVREEMRQAQRVDAIGRLAGGVAHDLNNLLSPILGYGEMLLEDLPTRDARRESVNEILRAGFCARDLVRQLLAFSRNQTLEFKPLDINEAVVGFEKLLRRTIPEDIEIEVLPSPDIPAVLADVGQIEQIIMNLAVNASEAMPNGGMLTIETGQVDLGQAGEATAHPDLDPGVYAVLAVRDTGCGMDEETRGHIFEPFFSTKGERGTGLGLSTVYGIVKQHGGSIHVQSRPGQGTTFEILLPATERTGCEPTSRAESAPDSNATETILLVEDDDQVRRLACVVLQRQGYRVLVAGNSDEALSLLASHDGPVHLLLTDVVMPGLNGRELYAKAIQEYPGLKVLFASGYTDDVIAHRGVLDEGVQFIQKPFSVQGLAAKVREILNENLR